jgi:hypothetical protein
MSFIIGKDNFYKEKVAINLNNVSTMRIASNCLKISTIVSFQTVGGRQMPYYYEFCYKTEKDADDKFNFILKQSSIGVKMIDINDKNKKSNEDENFGSS